MKYYYEFPLESETGKKMSEFHKACIEAENKAEEWAKKMGAQSYYYDPCFFAGGVSFLMFDRRPSKRRWKDKGIIRGEHVYELNVPTKRDNMSKQEQANAKLQDEQRQLPVVTVESLYALLKADLFVTEEAEAQGTAASGLEGTAVPEASASGKPKARRLASTPIVFIYGDQWYVGIDFPCRHDDFIPITESAFNFRKSQALAAEKNQA